MGVKCGEGEDRREILSYTNESDYLSEINDLIGLIHDKLVHYKVLEYGEYKKLTKEFTRKIDKYQEQPYVLDAFLEKLCSPLANCIAEFLEDNSLVLHETVLSLSKFHSKQNSDINSVPVFDIFLYQRVNIDRRRQKNILRLSDCIYNLCKVRGSKVISLYFPSNVHFLEVVIDYISLKDKYRLNLECESMSNLQESGQEETCDNDEDDWHFLHVMYVWLSTLVLIPFSLEVLDSKYMLERNHLFLRILESVIPKVLDNKYCITNEIACVVFAKVACRVDFIPLWSNEDNRFGSLFSRGMDENPDSLGILIWIKHLIKLGPVESIEIFIDRVIRYLNIPNEVLPGYSENSQNSPHVKSSYKFTSCRTVCITRLVIRCVQSSLLSRHFSDFENVLDWTLELLVEQNKSENSLLRHTASKCIAKILYAISGSRRAEGVLDGVLLLNDQERSETLKGLSPNELEGKCLTVAELLRTRLAFIFERYLPEILEFLQYCLNYEFWVGSRSFGIQIRDSACYIIWSLARGMPPEALRPYSSRIISSIIPLTVFDSQINGRRASCAALQELIGRIGGENVPFGISIVTIADFFSISSLKSSFLEVSTLLGALDTANNDDLGSMVPPDHYLSPKPGDQESSRYPFAAILCNYLVQNVFIHPNIKFRLLSTVALSKLVPFCHKFCFFSVLPFVSKPVSCRDGSVEVGRGWDSDLNVFSSNNIFRHSSLLIVSVMVLKGSVLRSKGVPFWNLPAEATNGGEIVRGYLPRELPNSRSSSSVLPTEFTWGDYVRNIPILIEKNRLYRGKGGDLTRKGVLNLICSLSRSTETIPFKTATFSRFLKTICESIKHLSFSIQISGCSALDAIIRWRMAKSRDSADFLEIRKLLVGFVDSLKSNASETHIMALRGIILSIGVIFPNVVGLVDETLVDELVSCLIGIFSRDRLVLGGGYGLDLSIRESDASFGDYIFSSKYDIECRRNSVWSLGVICYCISSSEIPSKSEILSSCHDVFVHGCFDYSTDKRGDVGSWVRELSMETLACLYSNSVYVEEPKYNQVLSAFVFNIFNYSDKLRVKAILLLWKLLRQHLVDSNPYTGKTSHPKTTAINIYWIYYRIFHGIPFELFEVCQIRDSQEAKAQNPPVQGTSLKYKLLESCQKILEDILKDYALIHNESYMNDLRNFFCSEDNPFNSGCYFFDMLDSIERVPHSLLAHLDFENQFLFFLSNRNFQVLSSSSTNILKKCLFPLILQEELRKPALLGLVNWVSHSSANPYHTINYELSVFLKSTPDISAASLPIFNTIEMLLSLLSACEPDAAFLCTCMTLHALQFILILFMWGICPHERAVLRGIIAAVQRVLGKTRDFRLIKVSSAVLVQISFSTGSFDDELSQEAMESLSDLVSHQYPNIRAYTTDYIYNNVCHIQSSEKIESILEFIRETNWTQSYSGQELDGLKTQFRRLCQLSE